MSKTRASESSTKTQIALAERSSILTSDSSIKGNVERKQDGQLKDWRERGEMCELGDRSVALICMHSSGWPSSWVRSETLQSFTSK